jgi:uncharacterized Zn finger protein (UPF0148 family)
MAGPIGFGVGAARGVKRVVCPKCGTVMARSKKVEGKITCKVCKHVFEAGEKKKKR